MLISVQEIINAYHDTDVDADKHFGASYNHITVSAQTTVKSGAGFLLRIINNATPTSALRLYDNTVSGGDTIGNISASVGAGTVLEYGLKFDNGLVISSGSSDTDITVVYL